MLSFYSFSYVYFVASVPGSKILEKAHREKLRENRGEASLFCSRRFSLTRFIIARPLFSLICTDQEPGARYTSRCASFNGSNEKLVSPNWLIRITR